MAALVVIVVSSRPDAPPDPTPPRSPVEAALRVVGEVSTSTSGVLVVPVEIVNAGPAVTVTSARVYAEPVRSDPATGGVRRVRAGGTGRVVALVQPDCRLLGPRSRLRFVASLGVRLSAGQGRERELFADLATQPFLARHVTELCRAARAGGGAAAASPGVGSVVAGMVFGATPAPLGRR